MKKIIPYSLFSGLVFFAVFILLLTVFVLCRQASPARSETVPAIPGKIVLAGPGSDTVCTVTYPAECSALQAAAEGLAAYVNGAVPDAGLSAAADSEEADTKYIIAVCAPDALLPHDYALDLDGTRISLRGRDIRAVTDAVNYLKAYCVLDGCFAVDAALSFSSEAGPAVIAQSPEKYYYYEDVYTPSLVYTFDGSQADPEGSRLFISGREYTQNAVWSGDSVSLSGCEVGPGDHTVLLALAGRNGAVRVFETFFSCGNADVMHLYAGEVHSHTSDSDGQGTVADAYAYARDTAHLDYFAVTDHSASFPNSTYQDSQIPNADSFNEPGRFAALYGYEQTYSINTGYYGHLNTLNRASLTTWELTLDEYYDLMAQDGDAVVMFNHPGYSWGNFVEYDHLTPEIDAAIDLIEVKGRNDGEYEYPLALTKGWHVSPVFNEDNHGPDWGTASEACGFALAPALTRQNIIDAFNKNRTYTTSDPTLRLYYRVNGEWMGSRLDAPDELRFSIHLSTERPQGLGTVSIVAEDGMTVASADAGTAREYDLELELPALYDYYYIHAESDGAWCYTAPVWIENREQLTVDSVCHELLLDGGSDHRAYAVVTNNTDRAMENVTVDFYRAALTGFSVSETGPLRSVTVGGLVPGQSVTVCADVRYKASEPRIYAVARGSQNGKEYGAVKYTELSALYITEILPYTSKSDAFEFIELYNNSDTVLDLSRLSLRYYPKAGVKVSLLEENSWQLSGKIQPHSVMVIWRVDPDSKYGVADFNRYFGTKLVEGRDIVILKGKHLPHKKPVQLELCAGKTVVGRLWYNWDGAEDVVKDRSIVYTSPNGPTITARVWQTGAAPTPGTLINGQVPGTAKP